MSEWVKEPVSQFYVPVAREALKEIEVIYWDYERPENLILNVLPGAHVVDIHALICFFKKHLKTKLNRLQNEK